MAPPLELGGENSIREAGLCLSQFVNILKVNLGSDDRFKEARQGDRHSIGVDDRAMPHVLLPVVEASAIAGDHVALVFRCPCVQ